MCRRRPLRPLDFQLVQISNVRSDQVPATLQSVEYKCQIINNILKTTLIQTFRSKSENEYSETQYLFPIEENICLESFVARFNENTIKGIVKSKEDAEKEYQDNKDQGNFVSYASIQKTPREEQVKIKLGNLPPGQQVEIVLTFSQQLTSILNKYYVAYIPLQYVEDEVSAKLGKNVLTLDLFCTGKITYSNSKGYPAEKIVVDDNTARFNLSQALLQKDMDFQVIYSYEGMFEPQVILGSSHIYNEDSVKRALLPVSNSAMVSFIPNFNKELTQEIDDTIRAAINNGDDILSDEFQQKLNQELIDHLNSSRSEFLFLLDRSGSMSGKPIEKACEALVLFLQSLPNDSYFNVISFGSSFQKLFPTSKKYSSDSLKEASKKIKGYKADLGGTEIYQPLQDIFQSQQRIQGYNKQIFLLTDGAVSQPENVVNLIKKNNKFNRVHSIGFGSGADKFLIEQSAVAGKGISKIIDLNSDLSEVIINMLSSCITPTYDDFSITYDQSIFDSTYPISTNFPCVFKDEIINIHFFFKPLVDLSSLNDAQKIISIQYYDSQLKQKVKKDIRLEMSDCFTCNGELQESVFKLGKQLYLNETISSSKNQGSELLQQALDFQLLTEKTALICVIEALNDEQKMMFQNIQKNITYSNISQQQQQQQVQQRVLAPNIMRRSSGGAAGGPPPGVMLSSASSSASKPGFFAQVKNFFSGATSSNKKMSKAPMMRSMAASSSSISSASYQSSSTKDTAYNLGSVEKKKSKKMDLRQKQCEIVEDDYCQEEKKECGGEELFQKQMQCLADYGEEDEECDGIPQISQKEMICREMAPQAPMSSLSPPTAIRDKADMSNRKEREGKDECKPQIQSKCSVGVKLETILSQVDNLGIWAYDEKLIKQFAPNLDQQTIKSFIENFTKKEAFMTLFVLCILELSFSTEKSKWILISKKSTSQVKQNIKEGQDFNTLKQMILSSISN